MKRPQQHSDTMVLCTLIVCIAALMIYAMYSLPSSGMKLNWSGPRLELEFRNSKIAK